MSATTVISPSARPLRVGVVGCGDFGLRHVRAYAARDDVILAAVADSNALRARVAAELARSAAPYADVVTMFAECELDAVSVAVPEDLHRNVAIDAIERGIHTLIEKPLATTTSDAAAIVAAARKASVVVLPGHICRFAAPYVALKESVAHKAVGDVVAIVARRDRTRAIAKAYQRVHPALLLCIHDIDLGLWLAGGRARAVRALEQRVAWSAQPVMMAAQVTLDTGVVMSLSASCLMPDDASYATSDRLEVYGTEGVAHVDLSQSTVGVRASTATVVDDWVYAPQDGGGALGAEISHFLECVRAGRPSKRASVADAVEAVRIAEAITTSASAGGHVTQL